MRRNIARQQEKKKEAAGSAEELAKEQKHIEEQKLELEASIKDAEERLASSASREEKMNTAVSELEETLKKLREEEGVQTQILAKWDTEIEMILQQQSFSAHIGFSIQRDIERPVDIIHGLPSFRF